MILVHTRLSDQTTIEVMQWLLYLGKKIFRLNSVNDLEQLQEILIRQEVQSAYYNGRGFIYDRIQVDDHALSLQIYNYLKEDIGLICNYLLSAPSIKRVFGALPYDHSVPNKLQQLILAANLGFLIPDFEIVTTQKRLVALKDKWGRIICKSFGDGINVDTPTLVIHGQKTQEVSEGDIERLKATFFPTFIQRLIEKQFEVRTFWFNKKTYSIAMFTQSYNESLVDGRTNNSEYPQRQVPFILPSEIETKLAVLMARLNLNYGSFDFIVTPENEFYFLEINPYGQYGFLSHTGNYYIEKEIAEYL